ncbi:MAG TPA: IPT/TIG domain-containing protein [Bryobacteraceae bacterium]|nr:IPT/TIG domain-containing protein [Bryobacteraceae bacterium]
MARLTSFGVSAGLLLIAATLNAQTLSNASLTGRYFVRHVQITRSASGTVSDSRSIQGAITFSGSGSYGFIGEQIIGSGSAAPLTVSGTYSVNAAGVVTLSNPQNSALSVNARYGAEAVIGASTESTDNTFDLFVAIPSNAAQANAALNGTYYAADFELSPLSDSLVTLSMNGAGSVTAVSATGHSTSIYSETGTGGNYSVSGSGTLALTGLTLVTGSPRVLAVSDSGNVFVAASHNAHDILIGVKAAASGILAPALWTAGLRLDSGGVTEDFAGAAAPINTTYITATERLHETGAILNTTESNSYTEAADGSGSWGPSKIGVGSGGNLMVSASGSATEDPTGYQISFSVASPVLSGSSVFINPRGVVNAASSAPGVDAISPGEFVAIYGSGLAGTTTSALPPYPMSVGNVSVTIGGIQAPIYFVSAGQIDCLVPYGVSGSSAAVVVNNNGTLSNSVSVPLAKTSPGIFSLDASGTGDGALLHLDSSVISAANPATKGEVVEIYLTGLGALTTPIADGHGATAADFAPTPISIYVGGVQVAAQDVLYWGVSSLPGLYQINFRVPANLTVTGELPLAILTPDAFHDQVNIAVQ